jgi:hypothetical protein
MEAGIATASNQRLPLMETYGGKAVALHASVNLLTEATVLRCPPPLIPLTEVGILTCPPSLMFFRKPKKPKNSQLWRVKLTT